MSHRKDIRIIVLAIARNWIPATRQWPRLSTDSFYLRRLVPRNTGERTFSLENVVVREQTASREGRFSFLVAFPFVPIPRGQRCVSKQRGTSVNLSQYTELIYKLSSGVIAYDLFTSLIRVAWLWAADSYSTQFTDHLFVPPVSCCVRFCDF